MWRSCMFYSLKSWPLQRQYMKIIENLALNKKNFLFLLLKMVSSIRDGCFLLENLTLIISLAPSCTNLCSKLLNHLIILMLFFLKLTLLKTFIRMFSIAKSFYVQWAWTGDAYQVYWQFSAQQWQAEWLVFSAAAHVYSEASFKSFFFIQGECFTEWQSLIF